MNQEPTPHPASARPVPGGAVALQPALPADERESWPEGSAAPELPVWAARGQQGFDLLRVYLGVGLFVRGVLFAKDSTLIEQLLGTGEWFLPYLLAHLLMISHVVGGVLLALGCYTRWAAAVQIPFVAGAVFFVHWHEGLLARNQSLEFAALVLFVLVVYTACGASRLSIDHYFRRMPTEGAAVDVFIYRRLVGASEGSALAVQNSARQELDAAELALPAAPSHAREADRDVQRELTIVIVGVGVLFVLLAKGWYIAAPLWVIATLVLFVVWRVGQADLPG